MSLFDATVEGFKDHLANAKFKWMTYRNSDPCDKKLQYKDDGKRFQVTHGFRTVYDGNDMEAAVKAYNAIVSFPNYIQEKQE